MMRERPCVHDSNASGCLRQKVANSVSTDSLTFDHQQRMSYRVHCERLTCTSIASISQSLITPLSPTLMHRART